MKGRVLTGVKDFQQGTRGITLITMTEFVNFINQDDWVGCPRGLETLNNLSRHGTHVGSSMSLDLTHLAQTTDRKTEKFPSQRGRY